MAPKQVWIGARCELKGRDRANLAQAADLARRHDVRLLATNDVLYHHYERRVLQDVVTCIREHLTLETAGRRLQQNAERYLKPEQEMRRLFAEHPEAMAETERFASLIHFSLDELKHNYPDETIGNGETAQQTLERLSWEGATRRYPDGIPDRVQHGLRYELQLIEQMRYAAYQPAVSSSPAVAPKQRIRGASATFLLLHGRALFSDPWNRWQPRKNGPIPELPRRG